MIFNRIRMSIPILGTKLCYINLHSAKYCRSHSVSIRLSIKTMLAIQYFHFSFYEIYNIANGLDSISL